MRPQGQPSLRWLVKKLSRHIKNQARLLHQYPQPRDRYNRRLQTAGVLLTDYLSHLSTENFISRQTFQFLYNQAMDLIENRRSIDYDFVEGALEGTLGSFFPHDEF
mgnify:CR=1 FL=1